jgi:hypothetical protein
LYFRWLMAGFGWITLVFAVLGRLWPEESTAGEDEETWNPRTLPEIADWTRLDLREVILALAFLAVALAAFNLFPQWAGWNAPASEGGGPAGWYTILSLSPDFHNLYLPLWNANFLLSILLGLLLLRRGRWERLTRTADFLLGLYGSGILAVMTFGPPLVEMQGVPSGTFSGLLRAGLFAAMFFTVVDSISKLTVVFRAAGPKQNEAVGGNG